MPNPNVTPTRNTPVHRQSGDLNVESLDRMDSAVKIQSQDEQARQVAYVNRVNTDIEQRAANRTIAQEAEVKRLDNEREIARAKKETNAASTKAEFDKIADVMKQNQDGLDSTKNRLSSGETFEEMRQKEWYDGLSAEEQAAIDAENEAKVIKPSVSGAEQLMNRVRDAKESIDSNKAETLEQAVEQTRLKIIGQTTNVNGKEYSEPAMRAQADYLRAMGWSADAIESGNKLRNETQSKVEVAIHQLTSSINSETTDTELAQLSQQYGVDSESLEALKIALHMDSASEVFDDLGILDKPKPNFGETNEQKLKNLAAYQGDGGLSKIKMGLMGNK